MELLMIKILKTKFLTPFSLAKKKKNSFREFRLVPDP